MYSIVHSNTVTDTDTDTHARTLARTHARTHTHTHTHKPSQLCTGTYLRVKGDDPQGPHRREEEKGKPNLNDVGGHNTKTQEPLR